MDFIDGVHQVSEDSYIIDDSLLMNYVPRLVAGVHQVSEDSYIIDVSLLMSYVPRLVAGVHQVSDVGEPGDGEL